MTPLQFFSRNRRPAALIAVLALTGFWLVHRQSGHASGSPANAPAKVQPSLAGVAALPSPKAGDAEPVPDIFAVRTWEPAQLPTAMAAAPTPPQAPPLPFHFLGRIADPEHGTAFLLTRGDQVLSLNVGDVVDQTYRVEKYEGGQLYFVYQPMNIRQSLFVGSDS